MESLIREAIVEYMSTNKLFSNKQFGFIKKGPHSTTLNTTAKCARSVDGWT